MYEGCPMAVAVGAVAVECRERGGSSGVLCLCRERCGAELFSQAALTQRLRAVITADQRLRQPHH